MGFSTTATLVVMRKEDFSRVFNFIKPDEHDKESQTDEEYKQVLNYVDTLSGGERAAWMTRHCTRPYVDFRAKEEELELSWNSVSPLFVTLAVLTLRTVFLRTAKSNGLN